MFISQEKGMVGFVGVLVMKENGGSKSIRTMKRTFFNLNFVAMPFLLKTKERKKERQMLLKDRQTVIQTTN